MSLGSSSLGNVVAGALSAVGVDAVANVVGKALAPMPKVGSEILSEVSKNPDLKGELDAYRELLAEQRQYQRMMQVFSHHSQISKSEHETRMSVINNLRVR
jgi:hypothetical protein